MGQAAAVASIYGAMAGTASVVKKAITPPKMSFPGSTDAASVDVEGAAAAERERLRLRRQRGRAANILTSALGDMSTPNLGKKVLLGQ